MSQAQHSGLAVIRVHVDGREQAAETNQVFLVVNVMGVPVGLGPRTEIGKLDTDLPVFLFGPSKFLVDIAGGYEGTVGVVDLVPVQADRGGHLAVDLFLHGPAAFSRLRRSADRCERGTGRDRCCCTQRFAPRHSTFNLFSHDSCAPKNRPVSAI